MSAQYASSTGDDHRVNQDTAMILNRGRVHTYVVCDGHGDHGEKVSRRVAAKTPVTTLSYILDNGDFDTASSATEAIRNALEDLDADVKRNLKAADSSGCTVAGVLIDSDTGSGYMFGVGDSMVVAFHDDGTSHALHLQNASNAPQAILNAASDLSWRTRKAYIGGPSNGAKYMMFPGEADGGGLQLYSTIGDFDLKRVNSVVRVYPQVSRVTRRSGNLIRFLVTSDGYLDGIPHKPLSTAWYTAIRTELDAANGDARDLVEMAKRRGSQDDITVLSFSI